MSRKYLVEFLEKAYAMVDDPSTDSLISWSEDGKSFIVWHQAECCRNLLPRLLRITNFRMFNTYGFRRREYGGLLEFTSGDFVRGKPELLVKIVERRVEERKEYCTSKVKPLLDRLKSCKNQEEKDLVMEEQSKKRDRELMEIVDKAYAREIDDLMKRIEYEKKTREVKDPVIY